MRRSIAAAASLPLPFLTHEAAAEVMDKMPSASSIWLGASACIAVALVLGRWRWWLALLPAVLAIPFAATHALEAYDLRVDILREAGFSYFVATQAAAALSVTGPILLAMFSRSRASS